MKGWKEVARVGVRIKRITVKSTDGCQRLGTIQWELRGRETRVASFAQDGGKIQKIFSR